MEKLGGKVTQLRSCVKPRRKSRNSGRPPNADADNENARAGQRAKRTPLTRPATSAAQSRRSTGRPNRSGSASRRSAARNYSPRPMWSLCASIGRSRGRRWFLRRHPATASRALSNCLRSPGRSETKAATGSRATQQRWRCPWTWIGARLFIAIVRLPKTQPARCPRKIVAPGK